MQYTLQTSKFSLLVHLIGLPIFHHHDRFLLEVTGLLQTELTTPSRQTYRMELSHVTARVDD